MQHSSEFYDILENISKEEPKTRARMLTSLHDAVVSEYLRAIREISPERASMAGSDGRTLAQVVGHIAEWERFTLQALGEILSGVRWPGIMDLSGYTDMDGLAWNFASVNDFNRFQAQRHAAYSWNVLRREALGLAVRLRNFLGSGQISVELMEGTRTYAWSVAGRILTMPCAWYLWMVTLEHEAVEHAADIGFDSAAIPDRETSLS